MTADEKTETLRKIEKHLEALVRFQYAQLRKQAIASDTEEKAYQLTGTKTQREICDELEIGSQTLSAWWNRWFDLGLLVRDGKSYKKTVED